MTIYVLTSPNDPEDADFAEIQRAYFTNLRCKVVIVSQGPDSSLAKLVIALSMALSGPGEFDGFCALPARYGVKNPYAHSKSGDSPVTVITDKKSAENFLLVLLEQHKYVMSSCGQLDIKTVASGQFCKTVNELKEYYYGNTQH